MINGDGDRGRDGEMVDGWGVRVRIVMVCMCFVGVQQQKKSMLWL